MPQAARLSSAEQWAKLTGVVASAIDTAQAAQKVQAAAAQQLDLAQYALSTLMDELSHVMDVPGWRKAPVVHRLAPVAVSRPAAAALAA